MESGTKKKIILVEDDNIISFSQSRFLTDKGFDVTAFSSGEECLRYVESGAEFDLVLMDIDLGAGIDGITTARRITELRGLPVVFLTAMSDEATINRINEAGLYGFVVKNSGNYVLLSAIAMAFRLYDSTKILKESEQKYRFIAENSADVISQLDAEGKVTYISPLCRSITGYDEEELIGVNNIHFYHKDDWSQIIETFNKIKSTPGIFTFNNRFRLKNGNYRWIETTSKRILSDDGTVTGVITSSRDITAKVEAEKALRDSEERLHLIMNSVPALMSFVDGDDRFIYVNDEYQRWFGFSREDMIGKYLKEIIPPDIFQRSTAHFRRVKAGECVSVEDQFTDKQGNIRYVKINLVPYLKKDDVAGFFTMIFDITENKKSENKILTLLNEKDLLLKEVHHRVKNNMGSIAALLYLQMDSMDNPVAVNALQDARSRVISMMGIYDILYRSGGGYKSVDTGIYFLDLLRKISSTYITSPRIKLETDIDTINLDSGTLFPVGMIVNELLTNAVKYAFTGGRSGIINVSIKRRGDRQIEIVIRDNGVGLPDAMEISGSRGFGLTLVKMMIQQINGSIKINRIGGTEFRINFSAEDAG